MPRIKKVDSNIESDISNVSNEVAKEIDKTQLVNDAVPDVDTKIADLTDKVNTLTNILEKLTSSYLSPNAQPATCEIETSKQSVCNIEEEEDSYEEPSPNKQIRIMSLYSGILNLSDGIKVCLKFDKYGEVRPILYSKLMDIVNTQRTFAEDGKFYILDKNAVYFLGLKENYDTILDKGQIDRLISECNVSEIKSIGNTMTESQKDVVVNLILGKINEGQNVDLNRIDALSKTFNIDINSKIRDMQELEETLKSKSETK